MRPLALLEVPVLQDIFQSTRTVSAHSLVVHADRRDVEASGCNPLNGVHVCKLLDQNTFLIPNPVLLLTPLIGESLQTLAQSIRVAARQDDLWAPLVGTVRVQVLLCELADELVERRVSLCGTILLRTRQIDLLDWVLLGRGVRD